MIFFQASLEIGVQIALGLMSGTSMDGIDLAILRTDGMSRVERGPHYHVAYEAGFRRMLEQGLQDAKRIGKREERPGGLAELEREITLRHADAVRDFLGKLASSDKAWSEPTAIGFHGQTVLHRPESGLTVQLGDGSLLAKETGIPIVYDMRANDMVHGGQGAPLAPVYHEALAHGVTGQLAGRWPKCFVNIGGISNITYVPEEGEPIAFDSGPGNALIDQWVQREGGIPFDEDGRIASEGGVVRGVVKRYLGKPFFARSGPKSLDRLDFTLDEADGLELSDGARTLANVSAGAILKSAEHLPTQPAVWIVCGGGRKNPHIMRDLREGAEAVGATACRVEDLGFNGDSMEAEAWAYLAVRSIRGLPLTFPTTTGCREAVSGGVLAKA